MKKHVVSLILTGLVVASAAAAGQQASNAKAQGPISAFSSNATNIVPVPGNGPGEQLKTYLSGAERGRIAATLVRNFASDVYQGGGNVNAWAAKLGRAIGLADAMNVQRAARQPTLKSAMAALMGQHPESSSMKLVAAQAKSGNTIAAKLGDPVADLTYTPLPNGRCRVADSRNALGPIGAAQERGIDTEDTSSYAAYGGTGSSAGDGSTNCGIPSFVAAVALSVTVLPTTPFGFFKVYSNSQVFTDGNTIQWSNSGGATNDMTVISCQGCAEELKVYASSGTHYVIDVVGYYMRPEATELDCTQVYNAATTAIPLDSFINVADSSIAACPTGYTGTSYLWRYSSGTGAVAVWGNEYGTAWRAAHVKYNATSTFSNVNVFVGRECCRVPGR